MSSSKIIYKVNEFFCWAFRLTGMEDGSNGEDTLEKAINWKIIFHKILKFFSLLDGVLDSFLKILLPDVNKTASVWMAVLLQTLGITLCFSTFASVQMWLLEVPVNWATYWEHILKPNNRQIVVVTGIALMTFLLVLYVPLFWVAKSPTAATRRGIKIPGYLIIGFYGYVEVFTHGGKNIKELGNSVLSAFGVFSS